MTTLPFAARNLLRQVARRGTSEAPCWIMRGRRCGLIAQSPAGEWQFVRGYLRRSLRELEQAGLVRLGELAETPVYTGGGDVWRHPTERWGRTIELTEAGRQAVGLR